MKSVVVYFSRGGSTRKIAEAIAAELASEAVDVTKQKPDVSGVDLRVVGSGTYGGKPGKELVSFLDGLAPASGRRAACFSTCGFVRPPRSIAEIRSLLESKGYTVVGCYDCLGKFLLKNRGRPSEEDVMRAREFARSLAPAI